MENLSVQGEMLDSEQKVQIEKEGVTIKERAQKIFLPWAEVAFVLSEDHQSCFVSSKRRVLVRQSLLKLEPQLALHGFARVNRQIIVNLAAVKRVSQGKIPKVLLNNGDTFPLARRRRSEFLKRLDVFIMDQAKREHRMQSFRSVYSPLKTWSDSKLWVYPGSKVQTYLAQHGDLARDRLEGFELLAKTPSAIWLGDWTHPESEELQGMLTAAEQLHQIPVLVIYRLYLREETKALQPSTDEIQAYKQWILKLSQTIGPRRTIVILEPNALSLFGPEMPLEVQETYLDAIRFAVAALRRNTGVRLYLDAGHSAWRAAYDMAVLLARAGVDFAHGFSLNVSHFIELNETHDYGLRISRLLGNKPFVIDTSRNGRGITDPKQWCNPKSVAIGRFPTLETNMKSVDAFLWIKPPGESDGTLVSAGIKDGDFSPELAWSLLRNMR